MALASPIAELCRMLRAPPNRRNKGREENNSKKKNRLCQEEVCIKEPDFLYINLAVKWLIKTQALSPCFQTHFSLQEVPRDHNELLQNVLRSFWTELLGFGERSLPLPMPGRLNLLVRSWGWSGGSTLFIHKKSLTFWDTTVEGRTHPLQDLLNTQHCLKSPGQSRKTYTWISYTFFRPYLFVHTQYMRSRKERKKNHKPNQIQPCMLCFLPQSLSVKPTSGCSINVLFKEREFPRSVYLHCLRPCGRAAFWREAHRQLIALK